MNRLVSFLSSSALAMLFCMGCGRLPGKPSPADIPLEPSQVRDFATLFSQNCAGCHGTEGQGDGALACGGAIKAGQRAVKTRTLRGQSWTAPILRCRSGAEAAQNRRSPTIQGRLRVVKKTTSS